MVSKSVAASLISLAVGATGALSALFVSSCLVGPPRASLTIGMPSSTPLEVFEPELNLPAPRRTKSEFSSQH